MKSNEYELDMNNSIELLTSILLKYPVINTVDIDLQQRWLKMSFLINSPINNEIWNKQKETLYRNFRLFNKLEKRVVVGLKITKEDYEGLTRINLIRNLEGVSQQELNFMITIIKNIFSDNLLQNEELYLVEEDDSIDGLLNELEKDGSRYIGFREENRVLVFDKRQQIS